MLSVRPIPQAPLERQTIAQEEALALPATLGVTGETSLAQGTRAPSLVLIGKRVFRCGTDFPASCSSFINISLLPACWPRRPSAPRMARRGAGRTR